MNDVTIAWLLTGIAFVVFELMFSGMVFLFFSHGAFASGILALLPFCTEIIWLQIVLFLFVSALGLLVFRTCFVSFFSGTVFDPNGTWFWKKGGRFTGSFGDAPSFVKGHHICHNAIGRMVVSKALIDLLEQTGEPSSLPR